MRPSQASSEKQHLSEAQVHSWAQKLRVHVTENFLFTTLRTTARFSGFPQLIRIWAQELRRSLIVFRSNRAGQKEI